MADRKDYYRILGVARNADADAVRRAYRMLAKRYHPDANPGSGYAEERFKLINEAYRVLSDPEKRWEYDHPEVQTVQVKRTENGTPGAVYSVFHAEEAPDLRNRAGFSFDDAQDDLLDYMLQMMRRYVKI